ncbi:MAG: hypothetical protein ABI867_17965 [Kofleriaceae bacterium]
MRNHTWARWATCALALSICIPVALADTKRSISSCTAFDQEDKGDDKVQFSIKNSCTVPVDCSISWRVVCAPTSKKRRAVHPSSVKLSLESSVTQTADASASVCGDDAFSIDSIQWSCLPNND